MQQLNQNRYEEEQQLKDMLEDHELSLESLRKQLALKEAEVRRLLIVESNMKTQEQLQVTGDFILRQQTTPKGLAGFGFG